MREKLLKSIRQFTLSPELRRSRSLRITIYVVLSTLLYLLFIGNVLPERYDYVVGSIAEKTIKAPTDANDSLATKRVRDDARKKVGPQYNKDIEVEERAYANINTFFDTAKRVADSAVPEADKLGEMKKLNIPATIDDVALRTVITASADTQSKMRKEATRAVQTIYNGDIDEQQMAKVDEKIDAQLAYVDLNKEQRVVVKNLVRPLIQPNMIYDKEATDKKREEAAASVLPVVINKGEIIVKQGERIDEEAYNKLKDLRLTQEEPNYRMYFGFAGFIALWMLVLIVYLELTNSKIGHNNLLLVCLSMSIFLVAIFTKTVTYGEPLGFANIGYLTPTAMGTMLVTILFDTQLGILLSFLFALLTGAAFDMSFQHVFISFISGLTGAFAVSRVKHRMVIMRAGFIIAGINLVTIATTMALSSTGNDIAQVMQSLLFGIISGLFSAVVTIGFLPFLESSFGLLTPISLLELSNPNHPLLKKLLMEAPGTYHHSLIVGNLAEAAAEAVGADPLLCRVGAYFHDVGKMKRPLFFIENQMSKDNPHDKVAPTLSHLIITSHVRDGLEMQEAYRLPKPIRDICEQHHGTTVLMYFYNKALELDKSGSISMDDFRYAGPKPQTKEAAIIMLCDAVEAAVRAMNRPTPNRIESVIHKIVKDRLNDGQLDECNLTLKD
ncbi:MAG: HDIG domain-containing metalloprotein, partial [Tumebacillaceae bacterium]